MYLRPRNVFEKFIVEEKVSSLDERGSRIARFEPTDKILFGVISITTPVEVEKYKKLRHEVSHFIVQHGGSQKANVGDLLVKEDKKYLVQAVENIAGMGQWRYYLVNERNDL